jgi:hypothetical protein
MAAANGDGGVAGILFGVAIPSSTGAPGSAGGSGGPLGAADIQVTSPNGAGRIEAIGSHGVGQPGQTTEGISGVSTDTTGAGMGSTTARHPNSTARA